MPVQAWLVAISLAASDFVGEAHCQVTGAPAAPARAPATVPVEATNASTPRPGGHSSDSRDPLGGDRVRRAIDFGFIRDPRTPPVVDHRIRDSGIAVSRRFDESRDNQDCK